jgi:MFS family permease
MSIVDISNSVSGGIFLQGPGGIFAVPLIERYGRLVSIFSALNTKPITNCRLPVLFWSQVLSCTVVLGAALAPTYTGFTVCRTLQGLFNTAPQMIGLLIINDIFSSFEYARKINM